MTTRRLFIMLFAVALFAMAVRETIDPDMWWHLRTGEYILEEGLPKQDVFSFTVPDHVWITHEWLSQLFMWGVYQALGLPGLMIVFALLIGLSFWLIYVCCSGRPFLAAFVALLAALTSAIVWGARPQIFNLLLVATFVHIVERFKDKSVKKRALWLLPILTAIWANLHSGYLLGTVLLSAYVLGEALQRWRGEELDRALDWPDIRQLALVTVVGFLSAALNPNGPELWFYPFATLGSSAMQAYIQEWHSPDFHRVMFWPFGIMMAFGIVGWRFSPKRPTWSELLLFFGTAAAGLVSARHIPLFAIVSTPIIARHWLNSLERTQVYSWIGGQDKSSATSSMGTLLNVVLLALILSVTGFWTVTKVSGNQVAIEARYPVAAVDYLERAGLAEAHGYNSYNWGGYLIWRRLPVFIDGRADVYGDEFIFYYLKTFEVRSDWANPLDEFDVEYVLMERESPLTTLLATHDLWDEAYRDHVAQVFVRTRQRE